MYRLTIVLFALSCFVAYGSTIPIYRTNVAYYGPTRGLALAKRATHHTTRVAVRHARSLTQGVLANAVEDDSDESFIGEFVKELGTIKEEMAELGPMERRMGKVFAKEMVNQIYEAAMLEPEKRPKAASIVPIDEDDDEPLLSDEDLQELHLMLQELEPSERKELLEIANAFIDELFS